MHGIGTWTDGESLFLPGVHGELVKLDLVDELCLTIAPILAAGAAPRIAHGHDPVHHEMALGHAIEGDGGLLTRWVRVRHP